MFALPRACGCFVAVTVDPQGCIFTQHMKWTKAVPYPLKVEDTYILSVAQVKNITPNHSIFKTLKANHNLLRFSIQLNDGLVDNSRLR